MVGGKGHRVTWRPVHARACAYLPEQVKGRVGGALIRGSDGWDVGDDRPLFPLVGPGSAPLPSLLSRQLCLLTLLCGHVAPTSGEREHSSRPPAGLFVCLFRVDTMLLRSLSLWLGVAGLVIGGVESGCVKCVVHLLLLLRVSQRRCRVINRVFTLVRLLVSGVLRVLCRWQGPVP